MSPTSNSESEIRSAIEVWLGAVRANDAAKIAEVHAEDGRILVAGAPVIAGRAAIAEFWAGLLAATNDTVVFGPTTIDVDPAEAMAFEVGTYSFKTGDAGAETDNSGKYVVVWKKIDGAWKVCIDSLVAD
ncbi:SgcJ/EcaC family oxidoreductase [Methylopila sp. 73B]|uniref:YybH family protein n=1 Tax=Methylopila sp. 73B TaxID=1120792 RepID=UPI00036E9D4A|nr:SgcJ/EcaC family oxidoreductase [Methylopila sp. 73B]